MLRDENEEPPGPEGLNTKRTWCNHTTTTSPDRTSCANLILVSVEEFVKLHRVKSPASKSEQRKRMEGPHEMTIVEITIVRGVLLRPSLLFAPS